MSLSKDPVAGTSTDQEDQETNARRSIQIKDITLDVGGQCLLNNASLSLNVGACYGLVTPHADMLLKNIAAREYGIPPDVDIVLLRASSGSEEHEEEEEEREARQILVGLGFSTKEMQETPVTNYSGCWSTRINLAGALFRESTLLLLNEPTKYLDLDSVIWLNMYLQAKWFTILLISSDKCFLDNICTAIIHFDMQQLKIAEGSYSIYEKRVLKVGKRTTTKSGGAGGSSTPGSADMKSLFPSVSDPGPVISLALQRVDYPHPHRPELLFEGLNSGDDLTTKSRVVITGPGKSTLLKILSRRLTPTNGKVLNSNGLLIGWFDQERCTQLDGVDMSPVAYFVQKYHINAQEAQAKLQLAGLPADVRASRKVKDLSAQQKSQIVLAELSSSKHHILMLDDPTKNLDMKGTGALVEAIKAFAGGVVMVTNNEQLIKDTNSKTEAGCTVWAIEEKDIMTYNDIDCYRRTVSKRLEHMRSVGGTKVAVESEDGLRSYFLEFKPQFDPRSPELTDAEKDEFLEQVWEEMRENLPDEVLGWMWEHDEEPVIPEPLIPYPNWRGLDKTSGSYLILDGRLLPKRGEHVPWWKFMTTDRYMGTGDQDRCAQHPTDSLNPFKVQPVDRRMREALLRHECAFYGLSLINKTPEECDHRESAMANVWVKKEGRARHKIHSPNIWMVRPEGNKLFATWKKTAEKMPEMCDKRGKIKPEVFAQLKNDELQAGRMFYREMYKLFLIYWMKPKENLKEDEKNN